MKPRTDMEVEVEILDVTDAEARALLLSIDPLADLAEQQEQIHQRLMDLTPTDSQDLQLLWQEAQQSMDAALAEKPPRAPAPAFEEQYLLLITCRDETHQVELLQRFHVEALPCKALLS
jgi:hypothetical protein